MQMKKNNQYWSTWLSRQGHKMRKNGCPQNVQAVWIRWVNGQGHTKQGQSKVKIDDATKWMKLKGRGMLEEDGATQALADVTPAPSEDDVESSYEETKSRKVKKEDLSKAMKNAFPRKLRRTWPSACHGDSEDNEGKGNSWKHCTCFSLNKQTSSKLLLLKNLQQYHKHLAPKTSSIRDSLEHFHHCFSRSPKAKGFALNKEPKLRRTSLEPGQRQDCNHTNGLEKHSALPCCLVWNRAGRATVADTWQGLIRVDVRTCRRCFVPKRPLISDTLHVEPWARARALSRRIFSSFSGHLPPCRHGKNTKKNRQFAAGFSATCLPITYTFKLFLLVFTRKKMFFHARNMWKHSRLARPRSRCARAG